MPSNELCRVRRRAMSSIQQQSFRQAGKAKCAGGFQVSVLFDRRQFAELPTRGIHDPPLEFIFMTGQCDKDNLAARAFYDRKRVLDELLTNGSSGLKVKTSDTLFVAAC